MLALPSLLDLRLNATPFRDFGALSLCTALVRLELACNFWETDEDVVRLAATLRRLPALQHLNLADTLTDSSPFAAVASSIAMLSHLSHLDISGIPLGFDDTCALGAALQVGWSKGLMSVQPLSGKTSNW